ncbi:hypothetical protein GCM10023320_59880 [Pseudonocardia adelaidensis]|uniref:Uncharacterized protein n=1 Tax=Pseudonocardia adelaidensis TaxID=648754 RepID=A0ABP9NY28_9PSEU
MLTALGQRFPPRAGQPVPRLRWVLVVRKTELCFVHSGVRLGQLSEPGYFGADGVKADRRSSGMLGSDLT